MYVHVQENCMCVQQFRCSSSSINKHRSSTDLDLVPPVPIGISGDEVFHLVRVICNCLLPGDSRFCQVFCKSYAPGFSQSFSFPVTTIRHPVHRYMCKSLP